MIKHQTTPAIVLRRTNYGEADRILTLLTADLGKVSGIAKGARRLHSKLAGGLELLTETQISLIRGKTELYTVASARALQVWDHLLEDYDRLQEIYDLLKFIDQHTEDGEGQAEFELLRTALHALNERTSEAAAILSWFYLRYLRLHGRQPDMRQDSEGQPLDETATYTLDPDAGRLVRAEQGIVSAQHIKFWRLSLANDLDLVLKVGGVADIAEASLDSVKRFAQIQLR